MLRLGVTILALSGSLVLAQDASSMKSESVAIDSLLAEMDAPGALEGTGLKDAMEHKRLVLRFLRDIVKLKKVDPFVYLRCRFDVSFPVLEIAPEPASGQAVNVGPLRGRATAVELKEQLDSLFGLRPCGPVDRAELAESVALSRQREELLADGQQRLLRLRRVRRFVTRKFAKLHCRHINVNIDSIEKWSRNAPNVALDLDR